MTGLPGFRTHDPREPANTSRLAWRKSDAADLLAMVEVSWIATPCDDAPRRLGKPDRPQTCLRAGGQVVTGKDAGGRHQLEPTIRVAHPSNPREIERSNVDV